MISSSRRRESGKELHVSMVMGRDGVKRWESEDGFEMFRFNVPGKSIGLLPLVYCIR